MRIAFRADASPTQGTGHVMRCLTLAAAAAERGHAAGLFVNDTGVEWLESYIASSDVEVIRVMKDVLAAEPFIEWRADRVVIDSYEYTDADIDDVQNVVPSLVLVDFDFRNREASPSWYLDSNLGAVPREPTSSTWLTGSSYSLVRSAMRAQRDTDGGSIDTTAPHIVVFLGGSDPFGLTARTISAVLDAAPGARVSTVGNDSVRDTFAEDERVTVTQPGTELPAMLGSADIIVCAAGTSAWDVCTIAKPAVFLGLVDNQIPSIKEIRLADVGPAIDATSMTVDEFAEAVTAGVREILSDTALRQARVARMRELFDGNGAGRVIDALTSAE